MNVLKIAAATAALALTTQASAQVAVDFTGSVAPDFGFAAFDGAATPSADGIVITLAASGDNFGGIGTNATLIANPSLSATGTGFVTARLGATNDSPLIIAFREGASTEFFSYSIPASSFNETTFTTVEFALDSFFFNGDNANADSTPNEAIGEASVQSPFGAGNAFDFTVANIGIVADVAVPEPASLALLGVGGLALAGRRRRNA